MMQITPLILSVMDYNISVFPVAFDNIIRIWLTCNSFLEIKSLYRHTNLIYLIHKIFQKNEQMCC